MDWGFQLLLAVTWLPYGGSSWLHLRRISRDAEPVARGFGVTIQRDAESN